MEKKILKKWRQIDTEHFVCCLQKNKWIWHCLLNGIDIFGQVSIVTLTDGSNIPSHLSLCFVITWNSVAHHGWTEKPFIMRTCNGYVNLVGSQNTSASPFLTYFTRLQAQHKLHYLIEMSTDFRWIRWHCIRHDSKKKKRKQMSGVELFAIKKKWILAAENANKKHKFKYSITKINHHSIKSLFFIMLHHLRNGS